mmetsp:Transcript_76339/g.151310  ORF Transcript_76339/g.151310 Transcript_76339/m.151310 type:complete len:220 (-) Transcript_76339:138-797(-)
MVVEDAIVALTVLLRSVRLTCLGICIVHLTIGYLSPSCVPAAISRVCEMHRHCELWVGGASIATADDQLVVIYRMVLFADNASWASQIFGDESRATADRVRLYKRHGWHSTSEASRALVVDATRQAVGAVPMTVGGLLTSPARCTIACHWISRTDAKLSADQTFRLKVCRPVLTRCRSVAARLLKRALLRNHLPQSGFLGYLSSALGRTTRLLLRERWC